MPTKTDFDYIVVGAGSAGCVIAARLSRTGSVLLLEKGPSESAITRSYRNVLASILIPFAKPEDQYPTLPQNGLDRRTVPLLRGVMRGGCSSINGMIYIRGNSRDYDLWASLGNEGWSFQEVLPYFTRSEQYWGKASEFHGKDGPLHVSRIPNPSGAAHAFVEAARANGHPKSAPDWDFNGDQQEGAAGLYNVNIHGDLRASAASAFLDGIADRKTLSVATGVRVVRLVIERGRAAGVTCIDSSGQVLVYRAMREVIVAAGALESPKLLMLSGIGPAQHLESIGVPVTVHLPGVGQNLHDHLQIPVYYPANEDAGRSEFTAEAGLFLHTRDGSGAAAPDLQYHVLASMPGLPQSGPNERFIVVSPVLCAAQSRGELRLRSDNPLELPLIDPHYLECQADVDVLVYGLEFGRALVNTPPLAALRLGETAEPPFVIPNFATQTHVPLPTDRSELAGFVRESAITVWHPAGTCKMGRDRLAVVDPQLRVHGVDGLRVADASIMPAVPSGNTNAACYMIGEKCAAMIAGSGP
jgi:choline dehydrogenase